MSCPLGRASIASGYTPDAPAGCSRLPRPLKGSFSKKKKGGFSKIFDALLMLWQAAKRFRNREEKKI